MRQRPKSAKSSFETKFQANLTFRRNKKYMDVEKLHSQEKQYSALRRVPLKSESTHIEDKINASFLNTTICVTERSTRGYTKHRSRLSICQSGFEVEAECPRVDAEQASFRSKSFSIGKMTSRDYHHGLRSKPEPDERRFNNFSPFKPDERVHCDYGKMPDRGLTITPAKTQLEYNTEKLYQEYYYKKTTFQCKVDYKSEKKLKRGRIFFQQKDPRGQPATLLDAEKVVEAEKKCPHFKGSNVSKGNTAEFYRSLGRDHPAQLEMRTMNELTNYWKDSDGKINKKILDYELRKMKADLQTQRLNKIHASKKHQSSRDQMCDLKFFQQAKK